MSFDPLATAVDWLDAYRAGDIEAVLRMYAPDADICCACGGLKTISGSPGRRAYWTRRLTDYPVLGLDDLQQTGAGAMVSYMVRQGIVSAVLRFNSAGQISSQTCGPSGEIWKRRA